KGSRSGMTVRFDIQASTGSGFSAVAFSDVTTQEGVWKRFEFTGYLPGGVSGIRANFSNKGDVQAGDTFWLVQPQLELKPYATPYVDGDMPQAVWEGDPHNSSSTRIARGDVNYIKNTLVRYVEDGEHKVARIEGRTGQIGTKGRFTTYDGSLRLHPNDVSTLEVEDVVLYEHDVTQIEDKVEEIEDVWSVSNTSLVMDVPIKVPFIEEGTTNLVRNPLAALDKSGIFNAGYTQGGQERVLSVWPTEGAYVIRTRTEGGVTFQGH